MPIYQLTDCLDSENVLYTETDLSIFVGKVVAVEGQDKCFRVEDYVKPNDNSIHVVFVLNGVTHTYDVPKVGVGAGHNIYTLDLPDSYQVLIFWNPDDAPGLWVFGYINTATGLGSTYVNSTDVEIPVFSDWTFAVDESSFELDSLITSATLPATTPQNILECYTTCESCWRPMYALRDCNNPAVELLSVDERLEDLIGYIIKVSYYENNCFTVTRVPYTHFTTPITYIGYSNIYNTCAACAEQESVDPNEDYCGCKPEHIEEVVDEFIDSMHQQMMAKRIGIKFCCPANAVDALVRYEKLSHHLLCQDTPDLPEPEIIECCIDTTKSCAPTLCKPCETVVAETCNCQSSGESSPHDCHTYSIVVDSTQISNATGNTDTDKNNVVFFTYFGCKQENPTTVRITTAGTNEYCVLGIPLLGYYQNDNFIAVSVVRGDICTSENNCCNG